MTKIEWVKNKDGSRGETWNVILGCSIVSPGCTNCYAMRQSPRTDSLSIGCPTAGAVAGKLTKSSNAGPVWTGELRFVERRLLDPLKRKKPTTYFVNSMGDLFHEDVPDEWIDQVFAVMALCPQHTFQVLTKRAGRMRDYFLNPVERRGMIDCTRGDRIGDRIMMDHVLPTYFKRVPWPLDNVWLGVSTERQKEADERIPLLLQTPAAVRFISAEPLLGPIDLRPWLSDASGCESCDDGQPPRCHRDDIPRAEQCPEKFAIFDHDEGPLDADSAPAWVNPKRVTLNWVITGGESGPNARPSHPQWFRDIRDQCAAAGVAYFHKQNGEFAPLDVFSDATDDGHVYRCGKKAAGRLLDGITHDAMPAPPDHVIKPPARRVGGE